MKKIVKLYLIRHGQKEKNMGDPGLTELGKQQATRTGEYLKRFKIKLVYSSTSKRTIETANIIANLLRTISIPDSQLKERVNWGDDPKQSLEDFLQMWVKSSKDRSWQPPVGDSSINAGNRMLNFIEKLSDRLENNDGVVIVSHGGIIVDCLLNIFGANYINRFSPNFVENRDSLLSECSITILNYNLEDKTFYIEVLAQTDHLR